MATKADTADKDTLAIVKYLGTLPTDGMPARLQLARKVAGLSITEAAKRVGVNRATWSSWEQGKVKKLSFRSGMEITRALDVSPYWIQFGVDEKFVRTARPVRRNQEAYERDCERHR